MYKVPSGGRRLTFGEDQVIFSDEISEGILGQGRDI
jgi:hypothetical protein